MTSHVRCTKCNLSLQDDQQAGSETYCGPCKDGHNFIEKTAPTSSTGITNCSYIWLSDCLNLNLLFLCVCPCYFI